MSQEHRLLVLLTTSLLSLELAMSAALDDLNAKIAANADAVNRILAVAADLKAKADANADAVAKLAQAEDAMAAMSALIQAQTDALNALNAA